MRRYTVSIISTQPVQRVMQKDVHATGPGRACSAALTAFCHMHEDVRAGDLFISARDMGPSKLVAVELEGVSA